MPYSRPFSIKPAKNAYLAGEKMRTCEHFMIGTLAEHTVLILYKKYAITDNTHGSGLNGKCSFANSTDGFIIILRHLFSLTEIICSCRNYFSITRPVSQDS
jgi:hypothetical protein